MTAVRQRTARQPHRHRDRRRQRAALRSTYAAFFEGVLGPRLKYSCCYWPTAETTLAEAEEAMLDLFCRRRELPTECGCSNWVADGARSACGSRRSIPRAVNSSGFQLANATRVHPRPLGNVGPGGGRHGERGRF